MSARAGTHGSRGRTRRHSGRRASGLAVLSLVGLWGCGELTAGGVGEATVLMSDVAPATTVTAGANAIPGAPAGSLSAARPSLPTHPSADVEGTVTATLQVFVGTAAGRFVELTEGPTDVTLEIGTQAQVELATRPLEVEDFTHVRLRYQQVVAEVTGGLMIGDRPVTGTFAVRFPDDRARISEQDAVFQVRDDRVTALVIGLNSTQWLRLADADTHEVDHHDFHRTVDTRPRPPSDRHR